MKRKVPIGLWIVFGFVSYIFVLSFFIKVEDEITVSYNDWLKDKIKHSFVTFNDVKINTLEAVCIESTEFGSDEPESRTFFIPMHSTTNELPENEKVSLVLRVNEGEIFDFLIKKINTNEEVLLKEAVFNTEDFIFEGPFTGNIQESNKSMRKILKEAPDIDPNFKILSPRTLSPQTFFTYVIRVITIAFVSLLLIIVSLLIFKPKSKAYNRKLR